MRSLVSIIMGYLDDYGWETWFGSLLIKGFPLSVARADINGGPDVKIELQFRNTYRHLSIKGMDALHSKG